MLATWNTVVQKVLPLFVIKQLRERNCWDLVIFSTKLLQYMSSRKCKA